MSGHTTDSCRQVVCTGRFVAGALQVVLVLLLMAETGALAVAPQHEPGRTHDTVRQDRFDRAEAFPAASAVRIIEMRLTPDRASDRKPGGVFDAAPSAPSGAISEGVAHGEPTAPGRVAATLYHGPLYHLHRSLLL